MRPLLVLLLLLTPMLQAGEVIKFTFDNTDSFGNPVDQHIPLTGYLRGAATVGPVAPGENGIHFPSASESDYLEISHNQRFFISDGEIQLKFMVTNQFEWVGGLVSKESLGYDSGGHLSIYTTRSGSSSNGRLNFRLQSTSSSYTVTSSQVLDLDTWYNATFQWGAGGMSMAIDGAAVGTNAYTGGLLGNAEPWVLGALTTWSGDLVATPTSSAIEGYISDFRVINSATVPEPSTYLLLGSMLIAAMILKRRRQKLATSTGDTLPHTDTEER